MHDGAPAHFSIVAQDYLNTNYPCRWIGPVAQHRENQQQRDLAEKAWLPRSPDMNSLDFFLWGHLKSLVYRTPIVDENNPRNRIVDSFNTIRNMPGIFKRVRHSMARRMQACVVTQGGHFEHLI